MIDISYITTYYAQNSTLAFDIKFALCLPFIYACKMPTILQHIKFEIQVFTTQPIKKNYPHICTTHGPTKI